MGPSQLKFTLPPLGSEANNFALKGMALARKDKGRHLVVSAIEHQSVLHSAKFLEKLGFEVTQVPVDRFGQVDPQDIRKALRQETILVSIMMANSEVGTIQPIRDIALICQERGVPIHTDAVAAAGCIPLDVKELGVDALSLAGHQFYGPKGGAALYLKKGTRILPLIDGGIQEGGRRLEPKMWQPLLGWGRQPKLPAKK